MDENHEYDLTEARNKLNDAANRIAELEAQLIDGFHYGEKPLTVPTHKGNLSIISHPYYRWRAALMDQLTITENYTRQELADRFCLSEESVRNILKQWREREVKA